MEIANSSDVSQKIDNSLAIGWQFPFEKDEGVLQTEVVVASGKA